MRGLGAVLSSWHIAGHYDGTSTALEMGSGFGVIVLIGLIQLCSCYVMCLCATKFSGWVFAPLVDVLVGGWPIKITVLPNKIMGRPIKSPPSKKKLQCTSLSHGLLE